MYVEVGLQKPFLLIVLFEKLFRKSTLLGCKVEYLTVVELASEFFRQHSGDDPAAASDLSAYGNDQFSFHLSGYGFMVEYLVAALTDVPAAADRRT